MFSTIKEVIIIHYPSDDLDDRKRLVLFFYIFKWKLIHLFLINGGKLLS